MAELMPNSLMLILKDVMSHKSKNVNNAETQLPT